MLVADALAGMGQTPAQIVHVLHALLQPACRHARQPGMQRTEQRQELHALGAYQLRRTGGRRSTCIGYEVGNGEVGLVSHAADHREGASVQRTRHDLFVEGPQIFDAAAAAAQDQHVAFAPRRRRY